MIVELSIYLCQGRKYKILSVIDARQKNKDIADELQYMKSMSWRFGGAFIIPSFERYLVLFSNSRYLANGVLFIG